MSSSRHGSVIEPTDFRVAKDIGGLYEGYIGQGLRVCKKRGTKYLSPIKNIIDDVVL